MLSLVHCSLLLAAARLVMGSAWYQRGGPGSSTGCPGAAKVTCSEPDMGKCVWKVPGQIHGIIIIISWC